jgi:hypothetical protein
MSRYTVYVTPRAWDEIKALPGNMRQRIRRLITDLATDPRPPQRPRWLMCWPCANALRMIMATLPP